MSMDPDSDQVRHPTSLFSLRDGDLLPKQWDSPLVPSPLLIDGVKV